jgi:aspartate kinase
MIVAKFGGTSVADAAAITRLTTIVRSKIADRPVVVVSALARVTDALLSLARMAETEDGAAIDAAVANLVARHEQIAGALPGAEAALEAIASDAAELCGELRGVRHRAATSAELDAIAGRGELWSSRLIAAALAGTGLDAAWVDIRPIMVTDGRFTRATPYIQVLNKRARDCLKPLTDAGRVPVTQGFIGATATGIPTTLGRGGSDFTAALLGAALNAE